MLRIYKDLMNLQVQEKFEVFELTKGVAENAEIFPWSFGEHSLIKDEIKVVSRFFEVLELSNQAFVFDRGYVSKEMICAILNAKAEFMFWMSRGFKAKIDQLAKLGDDVHLFELSEDFPIFRSNQPTRIS